MSMQFERLFTPIQIRNKTVKNRIVFPCHASAFRFFKDEDEPDQYLEYLRARAKGGCGLIVVGNCIVHRSCIGTNIYPPTPEIVAPKLRKMADALHEHGTAVLMQLWHRGNSGNSFLRVQSNWGWSALPSPDANGEVCHEMDDDEVEEILNSYVRYSLLAKECGMDGVELHASHGYLIQQSWTNWSNQRADKWGEQMAFANELINRVRAAAGEDFIVNMRIVSDDFHAGGMDNVAMQKVAQALEATGKLDFLSVSQGSQLSHYSLIIGSMYIPPAAWVPLASGIKQVVKSIPVVACGRINDPTLAESVLADGHADMVGIVRGQIVDAEFANKAREGRVDDIRLCIACNQGCADKIFAGVKMTCLQNATVGEEKEIGTIEPALRKKKVVVVGGGPGGLEAARVAALKGHDVTLYEKENQLGGQINTLTKVPAREEFGQAIRYLTTQVNKLGVKVNLGVEATMETVKQDKPDAVIVATGSKPYIAPIPGSEQQNVLSPSQVLEGAPVGERVVIYDATGFQEAVTVAEFLADQGKRVEIITPYAMAGVMIGYTHQPLVWPRLRNKGVGFTVFTILKKISGHTLTVSDVWTGEERTIDNVDTVVMSTGYRANDSFYHALKGQVDDLYAIGDCYSPRRALDAIHEGYNTAFKI